MKLFIQSGRDINWQNKCFQVQLAKLNMIVSHTLAVSSKDICSEEKKQTNIPHVAWNQRWVCLEKNCILWQKIKSKATENYNAIIHGTNKQTVLGSTGVFFKRSQWMKEKTKLFVDIWYSYKTYIGLMVILLWRIHRRIRSNDTQGFLTVYTLFLNENPEANRKKNYFARTRMMSINIYYGNIVYMMGL